MEKSFAAQLHAQRHPQARTVWQQFCDHLEKNPHKRLPLAEPGKKERK